MKGDKTSRGLFKVIKPLKLFGVNIKSKNNSLPIEIIGKNF